ncbi:MAG TPA: hypothetical protein DCQ50_03755 [Chryseobacterium sp.]|nr:hypothetical protein [Chryseobacterium sp.]
MVQNELRLIDLTVEQLRTVLQESLPVAVPPKQLNVEDDIGGIGLAKEIRKLSFKTIYQLTSKRRIPFFKKGKLLYFCRKELENWIRSGKRQTITEIENEAANHLVTKRRK